MAKVEVGPPGVVEKHTERSAVADMQEKRNALVNRVGRLLPPKGIRVPHGKGFTCTIERSRLVPQPEEVIIILPLLADGEAIAIPFSRACVLLQYVSRKVGDG